MTNKIKNGENIVYKWIKQIKQAEQVVWKGVVANKRNIDDKRRNNRMN